MHKRVIKAVKEDEDVVALMQNYNILESMNGQLMKKHTHEFVIGWTRLFMMLHLHLWKVIIVAISDHLDVEI